MGACGCVFGVTRQGRSTVSAATTSVPFILSWSCPQYSSTDREAAGLARRERDRHRLAAPGDFLLHLEAFDLEAMDPVGRPHHQHHRLADRDADFGGLEGEPPRHHLDDAGLGRLGPGRWDADARDEQSRNRHAHRAFSQRARAFDHRGCRAAEQGGCPREKRWKRSGMGGRGRAECLPKV